MRSGAAAELGRLEGGLERLQADTRGNRQRDVRIVGSDGKKSFLEEGIERGLALRSLDLPEALRLGECQAQSGHLPVLTTDAIEEFPAAHVSCHGRSTTRAAQGKK